MSDNKHNNVFIFDKNTTVKDALVQELRAINQPSVQIHAAESVEHVAANCAVIVSILPNDKIVSSVSDDIMKGSTHAASPFHTHISCSTVSPSTSRRLEKEFIAHNKTFVAAPVFARFGTSVCVTLYIIYVFVCVRVRVHDFVDRTDSRRNRPRGWYGQTIMINQYTTLSSLRCHSNLLCVAFFSCCLCVAHRCLGQLQARLLRPTFSAAVETS